MGLSNGVTPLQSVAGWVYACMHPDDYIPLHTQAFSSLTLLCTDTLRERPRARTSVCHVRSCCVPPGVTELTGEWRQ